MKNNTDQTGQSLQEPASETSDVRVLQHRFPGRVPLVDGLSFLLFRMYRLWVHFDNPIGNTGRLRGTRQIPPFETESDDYQMIPQLVFGDILLQ